LQEDYEDIQAEGAELIAISADPLSVVNSTQQTLEITYPLLVDKDKEMITAYNVIDPSDTDIARPATYIINQEGRVAWKILDSREGSRVGPERILTGLKNL
jgi:peroxiredoxin